MTREQKFVAVCNLCAWFFLIYFLALLLTACSGHEAFEDYMSRQNHESFRKDMCLVAGGKWVKAKAQKEYECIEAKPK